MMDNQKGNMGQYLDRVGIWALIGGVLGLKGSRLGWCALLGPAAEKALGLSLKDMAADLKRQRQEWPEQQIADAIRAASQSVKLEPIDMSQFMELFSPPTSARPNPKLPLPQLAEPDKDARWRQVIIHPSIVLLLGKRGGGKSALGYRLLELFRYGPTPYVVAVPASARSLLPNWIGIVPSLEEVPTKAIALVDESYLHYHARGSMAQQSKAMSQLLNLSRQKEQTIIFVTQEARQVDRNIASSANVVVFKDMGMLQLEFDRRELNRLAAQAMEAFAAVRGDRRRWSFVCAPDTDFLGLLENGLPSFWKPGLSHLFAAGTSPSKPMAPKRMTPQQKAQKAREMHQSDLSYGEIARSLGVSRGTAYNWVNSYPYKRYDS